MAAIDQKLIDRINVLAKKKKEGTITKLRNSSRRYLIFIENVYNMSWLI